MPMDPGYLKFLALISIAIEANAEYGITNPQNLNLSIGEFATFTCEFNFTLNYVVWYLDHIPVQQYTDLDVYEHVCLTCQPLNSEIRIFVSPELKSALNNSEVQCLAIDTVENIFKFSLPAKLMVQGVLEGPSNMTAAFAGNSIILQWVQPYTLAGVVILGYHIQTTIINDYMKNAIVANGLTNNSNCYNYEICVQALTAAGFGSAACIIKGRNEVVGSLHDRIVHLAVFNHKSGNTLYDQGPYSCPTTQETETSIPDLPQEEFDITNKSSLVTHFHNNVSLIFNLALPGTANDAYITTTISLQNITYHIVNITIAKAQSGFYFHCNFAEHSTAIGCIIEIECENDINESCQLNVTRKTKSLLTSSHLNCSLVTLYGFDVVTGGTNDIPSVIKTNITLDFAFLRQTHIPLPYSNPDPTMFASSPPMPIEPNQTSAETIGIFAVAIALFCIDIAIVLSLILCTCIVCIRLHFHHVSQTKEDTCKTVPELKSPKMYVPRSYPEIDEMCGIEIHLIKKSELVAFSKGISHKKSIPVSSGQTPI